MANRRIERLAGLSEKMGQGEMVRLVYFGSSNTQRRIVGMHWGDWLELGYRNQYIGLAVQALNMGVGGETTTDLLGRFERDVAMVRPDAVVVTIGGNDSLGGCPLSEDEYRENLLELDERIRGVGAMVIMQTYYGCDTKMLPHGERMDVFMQIMRDVADERGAVLIDQYERWQVIMSDRELVGKLLLDAMHVTELGNAVMGLNLLRVFGVPVTDEMRQYNPEAIRIDELLAQG